MMTLQFAIMTGKRGTGECIELIDFTVIIMAKGVHLRQTLHKTV